jgi:hypothetical protein
MQSINSAAGRLYDPGRALAAVNDIPVGRSSTAPSRIDLGSFRTPDGVVVDKVRFGHFREILNDLENQVRTNPAALHSAVVAAGQRLVDLHAEQQRQLQTNLAAQFDRPHIERWNKQREAWRQAFANDTEIGRNRKDTTLSHMRGLLEIYGKAAGAERLARLKDYFTDSGAGDNPTMLHFIAWVSARLGKAAR